MITNKPKQNILENSKKTLEYINTYVLKDIGYMSYNYFQNILEQASYVIDEKNIEALPYFIFTQVEKNAKIDYTSLRNETIDFTLLDKKALVYYNYAQFFLDEDFLTIHLMQTKIGGMPIDKDIIKYTKKIPIDLSKYKEFMNKIK